MNIEKNDGSSKIDELLSKEFRLLENQTIPSSEIKDEVMDTLDSISLFADILDLFTVKFSQSEIDLISGNSDSSKV